MNEQRQLRYKQKVRARFASHNENSQWRMTAADTAARGASYVQNIKVEVSFRIDSFLLTEGSILDPCYEI